MRFRPEILTLIVLVISGCAAPTLENSSDSATGFKGPVDHTPLWSPLKAAKELQTAIASTDRDKLDRILDEADAVNAAWEEDLRYWQLLGAAQLAYADILVASNEGTSAGGLVQGMYLDAGEAFEKAVAMELLPSNWEPITSLPAPHLGLMFSRRAAMNPAGAWQAAASLLEAKQDISPSASLAIGQVGLEWTVACIQAGDPVPAAARKAEELLRSLIEKGHDSAVIPLADLYTWQGLSAPAREVLIKRLCQAWSEGAQSRLKNLDAENAHTYATSMERVCDALPADPAVLWYLGEARWLQSLAARSEANGPLTHEALDRAEECFLASAAHEPGFAESCRTWLHLVRTARGWALREEGRIEEAAEAFINALAADPISLEAEATTATLRLGIAAAAQDLGAASADGPTPGPPAGASPIFLQVETFLSKVVALRGDVPDWWNNLGLVRREMGVERDKSGDPSAASDYFKGSWDAYSRCVELAPEDTRLVNDRALIAVYYLDEHWELAERELHRAIEMGTRQLAELNPDIPELEQRDLDEAVGDAWENLAYLDVIRRGRIDRAPKYLEESVKHYPFEGRYGVMKVRQQMEKK
ncbi:MAG TPA: hypothetical protein DDW23_00320 [Planctomycetes bacterium]|nr:hypothetical protein [Planctomycetota bacterium]